MRITEEQERILGCLRPSELALVKTKAAKGGNPVPADEDGLEALVEAKYKL